MTAPVRRSARRGAFAAVALVVALAAGAPAAHAGSAKDGKKTTTSARVTKDNACSLIKRADVEAAFGGEATRGVRKRNGPDTECNWTIAANGARPGGTLRIGISFDVPPGAYAALANNPGWENVEGVGADTLFQRLSATLHVFDGRRILRLRGVFNDTTTRPITTYDARNELVALATAAEPRL